ncbi:MAG TPA: transposase [Prolixibacteraceae bacterium]
MSADSYIIHDQHAVRFLTFTIVEWIDVFSRASYKIEIANSLEYCRKHKGLKLYAFCLMSNHIHLVCRTEEPILMTDFIRDFKKHTAKIILHKILEEPESRRVWMLDQFFYAGKYDKRITTYKFWQEGYHAIQLESNELIDQKIDYVHQNPVRALIVGSAEDYLFSSASNYGSCEGVVEIDQVGF